MTDCSPFIRRGARRAIDVKWGEEGGVIEGYIRWGLE